MSKELDTIPFNVTDEIKKEKVSVKEIKKFDDYATVSWSKCIDIIKDNVSTQVFNTWFKPLKAISLVDNQLTIKVPSQFFCEWIEEHYYPLLQKTVFNILGEDSRLQYQVVVDETDEPAAESHSIKVPAFKHPPAPQQNTLPFNTNIPVVQDFPTYLNSRYCFDNFIRGDSNQLAYSAAHAVGQNPGGTRYNPLLIYSEPGLGKTHLIQGIGNFALQKNKNLRVYYTTSERFTMEFVNAIQNNKSNEFVNFYRSIDVLIVDDIQFFGGKEKTQDNFFHTFNALHQSGKQIVLTSDKPPRDLSDVDDRLISRFQWGLTVDIQSPDLEMRMAILNKKSLDEGIELPNNIVEYVARHITKSIRELEGVLISLIAKVTLDRRELNIELAKEVVHGKIQNETSELDINFIKQEVAKYFQVSIEQIESKSRKHEITLARQMAIYFGKLLTQMSLKTLGSHFNNRDHSTVLYSCQSIENYLVTDKSVKNAFETIKKKLQGTV